ncbi:G5 domain-containing protein [Krasilnikovia sp. MM14-A1004]|uniref:G5 domain-containing protein n=1 Tax=Krasilnikovia sp. MM14-A1004 TaxID=3373541 RepID=UPI00399CC142
MFAGTCALVTTVGGTVYGIAALAHDEAGTVRAEPANASGAAADQPAPSGSPAAPGSGAPQGGASGGDVREGVRIGADGAPVVIGDDVAPGAASVSRLPGGTDRPVTQAPPGTVPAAAGVRNPARPVPAPMFPQLVSVRTVTESRVIPFRTRIVRDRSLPRGRVRERRPGVPGLRSIRYRVTYVAGRETLRVLLGTAVTRMPQDRVVAVGAGKRHGGGGGHHQCHGKSCRPQHPEPPPSCANGGNQPGGPAADPNGHQPGVPVPTQPGPAQSPSQDPGTPAAPGGVPTPGVPPAPVGNPVPSGVPLPTPTNGLPVTPSASPGPDPTPLPVIIVPVPIGPTGRQAAPGTCD